jgi:hypothetical protein
VEAAVAARAHALHLDLFLLVTLVVVLIVSESLVSEHFHCFVLMLLDHSLHLKRKGSLIITLCG